MIATDGWAVQPGDIMTQKSIIRRKHNGQAIQAGSDRDLTGQAGMGQAIRQIGQQGLFIWADRGQLSGCRIQHMDMAGAAGHIAPTNPFDRQTGIAQGHHQAIPLRCLNAAVIAIAVSDQYPGHGASFIDL
jgi:hypothetical protein